MVRTVSEVTGDNDVISLGGAHPLHCHYCTDSKTIFAKSRADST